MQIALLTLPEALKSTLVQAVDAAHLESFDFSWDQPLKKLEAAAGFILQSEEGFSLPEAILEGLGRLLQAESAKGKPILGLGGAADFLVQKGLVPGLPDFRVGLVMAKNNTEISTEGAQKWVRLAVDYQYNAFTRTLALDSLLKLGMQNCPPRFQLPQGLLLEVKAQGLDVFHYCAEDGTLLADEAGVGIAALANKNGNVLAFPAQFEALSDASPLLFSLQAHLASGYVAELDPLYYWPRAKG